MGRQPCCDERQGLKKGPWSAEEDSKLVSFITTHGHGCWREVPKLAGLLRCGKSCRLRWINYLRPDLKRGMLSREEENLIIHLHASYGNKWSRIAAQLPGRTDNEIKNCWNTRIKKKLKDMGIDPVTHRPTGVNGPPGWIQRTDVNGPLHLGHSPIVPSNAYCMLAKSMPQEGLIGASPDTVLSPQVTASLSRTPPNTKCEDELSIDYSAESVCHDRSFDSNVNELRREEGFQGDSRTMFTRELVDNDGLHNAPHILPTCQVSSSIEQQHYAPPHMHNPPYMLHNALGMHNPPHLLHNDPHEMHESPYITHNSSHAPPHIVRMLQLQASHGAHVTMPHSLPAFRLPASHSSSPEGKMEETRIPSSSSIVNNEDDRCNEGNEVVASAIKEEDECMLALNYMKNVSPYVSPWMIKCIQEGGVPQQASQNELKDDDEGTSPSFSTTQAGGGQWSNILMSDVFVSSAEAEAEAELQVMSPLLCEISQGLNGQQSMGQWSNMDSLWF